MSLPPQVEGGIFLLLLTVCLVQTATRHNEYLALRENDTITGSVGPEITTPSPMMCSRRCTTDKKCAAYQYTKQETNNCRLILRITTQDDGHSFRSDDTSTIYKKNPCYPVYPCEHGGTCGDSGDTYTCTCVVGTTGTNCETNIDECKSAPCQRNGTCIDEIGFYRCECVPGFTGPNCETNIDECKSTPCQHGGNCVDGINNYTCICTTSASGESCQTPICRPNWTPPTNWTSADGPVYYEPFEHEECVGLERRAKIVEGKVDMAVSTTKSEKQWVDLGIITEACIPLPETCGPDGGAISMWIKVKECDNPNGILSSHDGDRTGLMISCHYHGIRYSVNPFHLSFYTVINDATVRWTHVVMNYFGHDEGQGIRVYYNGVEVGHDATPISGHDELADGRVVVGKFKIDGDYDGDFASLMMDELTFWNRTLTLTEIQILSN